MTETQDIPVLRYRRLGGGYRREDVEAALEKLLASVRTVESDLDELRERSAQLESDLEAARAEIDAYRQREDELGALLERAETLLARVEAEAASSPAGTQD